MGMEQGPAGTVEIEIDYDGGFVACLNDAEIARRGIVDDPVTRNLCSSPKRLPFRSIYHVE